MTFGRSIAAFALKYAAALWVFIVMAGAACKSSSVASVVQSARDVQTESIKGPEFEVATIKPIIVDGRRHLLGFEGYPGRIRVGSATVKTLIHYAFDVEEFQVSGGPRWTGTDRYDVEALESTTENAEGFQERATPSETERKMFQALLAERFGLKSHRNSKNISALRLVVGKRKLMLSEAKDPTRSPRGGVTITPDGTSSGESFGSNMSMADLAKQLSQLLDRPVIDQTGLRGGYDFHVPPGPYQDFESAVFDAMQRLGLNLKTGKSVVEQIIVDEIHRPTEN